MIQELSNLENFEVRFTVALWGVVLTGCLRSKRQIVLVFVGTFYMHFSGIVFVFLRKDEEHVMSALGSRASSQGWEGGGG